MRVRDGRPRRATGDVKRRDRQSVTRQSFEKTKASRASRVVEVWTNDFLHKRASFARGRGVGWRNLASWARRRGESHGRFAGSRVRVRAFATRGSARHTHRQHVVVVVAELLLGEQAQVLRARVEPQRRLHGCSSLRRTGFFRDAASPTDAVPNRGGERRRASSEGVGLAVSGEPRWRAERAPSSLTAPRGRRVGGAFASPRAETRHSHANNGSHVRLFTNHEPSIPSLLNFATVLFLETACTHEKSAGHGVSGKPKQTKHDLRNSLAHSSRRVSRWVLRCRLRWRARAPASRGTS